MLTLLFFVLLLTVLIGGWGYGRHGAISRGPASLVLLILVILALTGGL